MTKRQLILASALGACAFVAVVVLVVLLPQRVAENRYGTPTTSPTSTAPPTTTVQPGPSEAEIAYEAELRSALLQVAAGVVLVAGAYTAWRQLRFSSDQLDMERDGRVLERLGQAVDRLASDSEFARVGGAYSLCAIAVENATLRSEIAELLQNLVLSSAAELPTVPADIQASFVCLLNLSGLDGTPPLKLDGAQLPAVECRDRSVSEMGLTGTNLKGSVWAGVEIHKSSLSQAMLEGSTMSEIRIHDTTLVAAQAQELVTLTGQLENCDMQGIDLSGSRIAARFVDCDLTGADLTRVDARGSSFTRCDLRRVTDLYLDLRGCRVSMCQLPDQGLAGANLRGATIEP